MYAITDRAAALRLLQQYLLEISYATEGLPHISIDGVSGPETVRAVRLFQEQNNLPVTGEADYATWQEIFRHHAYARAARTIMPTLLPPTSLPLSLRAEGSEVYVLQILLATLCDKYPSLPCVRLSGRYDPETQYAVRLYQGYHGLPPSGTVDIATWEALAEEYGRMPSGQAG